MCSENNNETGGSDGLACFNQTFYQGGQTRCWKG